MYSTVEQPPRSEQNSITENQVFKEIIATEETYNKSLKLLDLVLQNANIEHSEILKTFKTIIAALRLNSDLLTTNIKQAVQTETTNGDTLREHRRQMLIAFFSGYQAYVSLYKDYFQTKSTDPKQFSEINAYITGKKILENPQAAEELADTLGPISNQNKPLSLESHLIQTVQRGPRYLLLLESILSMHHKLSQKPSEQPNDSSSETASSTIKGQLDETNIQEAKQLKTLVANLLLLINETGNTLEVKSYEFGDYTRTLQKWLATLIPEMTEELTQQGDATIVQLTTDSDEQTEAKNTEEASKKEADDAYYLGKYSFNAIQKVVSFFSPQASSPTSTPEQEDPSSPKISNC